MMTKNQAIDAIARVRTARDRWRDIGGTAARYADQLTVVLGVSDDDVATVAALEETRDEWRRQGGPALNWADRLDEAIKATGPFAAGRV